VPAVQHNATLRTPKHEGLYRYGRRCGLRAGGKYGAHLDLWGVTVELRAIAISLCVDASRRSLPVPQLLAQLQGPPRPSQPEAGVTGYMYTCTHVLYAHGVLPRVPDVIATACWLCLMLCLDPGLNPITNDQTPVVPFCYRIINVELWN
jgi:hypothetical protein